MLDSKLPFWKIENIQLSEVEEIECFDPSKCGDIPTSDNLLDNFDGESNNIGDSFALSCNTGKKGVNDKCKRINNINHCFVVHSTFTTQNLDMKTAFENAETIKITESFIRFRIVKFSGSIFINFCKGKPFVDMPVIELHFDKIIFGKMKVNGEVRPTNTTNKYIGSVEAIDFWMKYCLGHEWQSLDSRSIAQSILEVTSFIGSCIWFLCEISHIYI